jgi:Ran-binding protein 3
MRKEGVHSLLLNAPLFRELKLEIAQDPRYLRFAIPSRTAIEHFNLRVSRFGSFNLQKC